MKSIILLSLLLAAMGAAAQVGGDILNEAPLGKLPEGMSFEEYRDANRRIGVGLMLMSIPVPGMLHFYADEHTEGWICAGAAVAGVISIAAGSQMTGDDYASTDNETVMIGGTCYEKIPVSMEGDEVHYELRKRGKELSSGGAVLIGAGIILIAGEIAYDWIDGISTIELKRDRVRYKYGIAPRTASISPAVSENGGLGLALSIE